MDKYRRLLVHGLNAAVKAGRISLAAPLNDAPTDEDGHLETSIAGYPAIVAWSSISHGEIRVSVWWKYDHSNHPQANSSGNFRERFQTSSPLAKRESYPKFVGATVSGWLERKTGPHLQGRDSENLFDKYLRRADKDDLEALPKPTPQGYAAEGRFYM